MKKSNKIDDLFVRKLSSLERTPSPDLWRRIEQGQKKETRRLRGWYWYAAASATILLLAGYVMWQSRAQNSEPRLQVAQTELIVKPEEGEPYSSALEMSEKKALANTAKTESTEGSDQRKPAQKATFAAVEKAVVPTQPDSEQAPVLKDIKLAQIEKPKAHPEQLIAKTKEAEPLRLADGQAPGAVLSHFPQKRVVVAHVRMQHLKEENSAPSKFIRVMRQLKNAKQGDEVEWDELGFNPKRILARADERLRNGEDIISGKYQELKNKTKL